MAAVLLVEHTGSMKMRTFGGRLSWPVTLVGQGGPTGIQSFLGFLRVRASREQQNKAGLFHGCLALTKVLRGVRPQDCTAPPSTDV